MTLPRSTYCDRRYYMNSACIVCIAGGLEGHRPSKKNSRMHALLQEITLGGVGYGDEASGAASVEVLDRKALHVGQNGRDAIQPLW
jgi:hypothetical protein